MKSIIDDIKRGWRDMEHTDRLGYYWVVAFALLILATAFAILAPAVKSWMEEIQTKEAEQEESRNFSPQEPLRQYLTKAGPHGLDAVNTRAEPS